MPVHLEVLNLWLYFKPFHDGYATDREHERRQRGLDTGHTAGSVYNTYLQYGSVCDFEY